MTTVLDFDLSIERAGDRYRANVIASPAGQASHDFTVPFANEEVELFLLRIGRPRRQVRRIAPPELGHATAFGAKLFRTVFADDVGLCLARSIDLAEERRASLRIRLRMSAAQELADLPWEFMHSPQHDFLCLSTRTPLVRYLDLPRPARPLLVPDVLRVLVVSAAPHGAGVLDVGEEVSGVVRALRSVGYDKVEVEFSQDLGQFRSDATLSALQRTLRARSYHVLHFIGHGAYLPDHDQGALAFQDRNGGLALVSGAMLGTILHDYDSLRLVVLNACEGARTGKSDPFSGVAQALVRKGLPAVVAMQFEISDTAAVVFAKEFYLALAENNSVEFALTEARKLIFGQGDNVEWGTPVLFLRGAESKLFNVSTDRRPEKGHLIAEDVKQAVRPPQPPVPTTPWEALQSKLESALPLTSEEQSQLVKGLRQSLPIRETQAEALLALRKLRARRDVYPAVADEIDGLLREDTSPRDDRVVDAVATVAAWYSQPRAWAFAAVVVILAGVAALLIPRREPGTDHTDIVAKIDAMSDRAPETAARSADPPITVPHVPPARPSTRPQPGDDSADVAKIDAMRGKVRGTTAQTPDAPVGVVPQASPALPDLSGAWRWGTGNESYQLVQDGRRFEVSVRALDTQQQVGKGNGYLEEDRFRMVLGIRRGGINYGNLDCSLTVAKDLKSMDGTCGLADRTPITLTR